MPKKRKKIDVEKMNDPKTMDKFDKKMQKVRREFIIKSVRSERSARNVILNS